MFTPSGLSFIILCIIILYLQLFYGNRLGINVILFIGPLLGFLYYVLKQNKKINNKKGLLFMIPIILLSIFYLIYDNVFFKVFNVLVITELFLFMYLFYLISILYIFFITICQY